MSRKSLALLAPLAAAVILVAATNRPATVGAPWISLELPANPMDPTTRGAAFVVHTYYHENAARFPLSGTAEGIVKGKRQSIPLEFAKTDRPGVYAVRQQWQAEGSWVLAINLDMQGGSGLLVELGPNGGVKNADYYDFPSKVISLNSVRVVGGGVDAGEIDRTLKTMTKATDE